MAASMSLAEATPSSSILIASSPMAMPRRLLANPGEFLTVTGVLPHSRTQPSARSRSSSAVWRASPTSTDFAAGGLTPFADPAFGPEPQLVGGVAAEHDLDELAGGDGVEEVQADDPLRMR